MSTRMGTDKGSLTLDGRSWLERGMHTLEGCFERAGIQVHRIVASGLRPGFDHVPDLVQGVGPLGGIHAVANAFPGYGLLILPVDMLGVSSLLLSRILSGVEPDIDAVRFEQSELPMFLHSSERVRRVLDQLVQPDVSPKSRSVRSLLSRVRTKVVDADCESKSLHFVNLNSPADVVRWSKNGNGQELA